MGIIADWVFNCKTLQY